MTRALVLGLTTLLTVAGCATLDKSSGEPPTPPAVKAKTVTLTGDWPLLPTPRQVSITGAFDVATPEFQAINAAGIAPRLVEEIEQSLKLFPQPATLAAGAVPKPSQPNVTLDPRQVPYPQGYYLTISGPDAPGGPALRIVANDAPGLFYAAQTLTQLARLATRNGGIPVCHIVDWPDFPNRGVMLDVARDKVPEMQTLFDLVDLFASWKYNQLQLYTEHTFAYAGHETVWKNASPMTAEQVRELDAYCRERYVQLIPNQNSFGHMGRWLQHPEYAHLSETPGGSDLCPVEPGSIELLRSMYANMLPNFSSPYFNVGCDETWSLGKGRSKAAVDAKGVGRVYFDFLMQIRQLVIDNGKSMQFWADIINNHPEFIPELPKDVVAMEWGYEADHPYAEHTKRFADYGVRFYVVPGTSSWNSLLGRTDNAIANLRNAARHGIANGGEGFLITDWGDGGHWQFLPVSYLPYAYGAAVSWCYDSNEAVDIAKLADIYAFEDDAGVMGRLAYDLGNVHLLSGTSYGNNTIYYMVLRHRLERPFKREELSGLRAAEARLSELLPRLDATDMRRPDADLIKAEYAMNLRMAIFACRLGTARLNGGLQTTSALPRDVRLKLAAELDALIPEYRQLWLARNRPGGLDDSAGALENIVLLLKAP